MVYFRIVSLQFYICHQLNRRCNINHHHIYHLLLFPVDEEDVCEVSCHHFCGYLLYFIMGLVILVVNNLNYAQLCKWCVLCFVTGIYIFFFNSIINYPKFITEILLLLLLLLPVSLIISLGFIYFMSVKKLNQLFV